MRGRYYGMIDYALLHGRAQGLLCQRGISLHNRIHWKTKNIYIDTVKVAFAVYINLNYGFIPLALNLSNPSVKMPASVYEKRLCVAMNIKLAAISLCRYPKSSDSIWILCRFNFLQGNTVWAIWTENVNFRDTHVLSKRFRRCVESKT